MGSNLNHAVLDKTGNTSGSFQANNIICFKDLVDFLFYKSNNTK